AGGAAGRRAGGHHQSRAGLPRLQRPAGVPWGTDVGRAGRGAGTVLLTTPGELAAPARGISGWMPPLGQGSGAPTAAPPPGSRPAARPQPPAPPASGAGWRGLLPTGTADRPTPAAPRGP